MFVKTIPPPGCIFIDKRQLNQFLLLLNNNEDCLNLFLSKLFSLASPSLQIKAQLHNFQNCSDIELFESWLCTHDHFSPEVTPRATLAQRRLSLVNDHLRESQYYIKKASAILNQLRFPNWSSFKPQMPGLTFGNLQKYTPNLQS